MTIPFSVCSAPTGTRQRARISLLRPLLIAVATQCVFATTTHALTATTSIEQAVVQPPASTSVPAPTIPVRTLAPSSAVSKDSLGLTVIVRALSTGAVLVNDVQKHRVLYFDSTLATSRVAMDSAATSPTMAAVPMAITPAQLIAYPGDSTLFVDMSSNSLLVLDPKGNVSHVMSLPRPQDAMFLAQGQALGMAAVDAQGRMVYRGVIINLPKPPDPNALPGASTAMRIPEQPDSAPIVRADFDTRRIDTVATIKALKPGSMSIAPDKDGNIVLKMTVNPLDTGDEWAMTTDGTIAIVRAHDYHIDWVHADGTKRSTPKMAFDWKRLTDEQKQYKADSLRPIMEKQVASSGMANRTIPTPNGPRKLLMELSIVPPEKMADYEPAISPGSVRADLDNNLWIVPRTAIPGGDGGLRYDVVNHDGVVFQRVQFPKGTALAGFGPGGAIYVLRIDGTTSFLERTTLH